MRTKIILVNAVPFAFGILLDRVLQYAAVSLPLRWIGILYLAVWGFLAFLLKKQITDRKTLLLSLLAVFSVASAAAVTIGMRKREQ